MNDLQITPENIVNITFQYKPAANVPQGKVNFASIFVTIDTDGVERYLQITLDQVLTFIKMLEIKAALESKFVIAVQSVNVEQYTVIKLGDAPDVVVNGEVNFQLNGVNFSAPQALGVDFGTLNGSILNNHTLQFGNILSLVSFRVPKFTNNFANDYTFVSSNSAQWFSAQDDGDLWNVICIIYNNVDGNTNLNLVANEFILFQTTDCQELLVIIGNSLDIDYFIDFVHGDNFYLPKDPAGYFFSVIQTFFFSLDWVQLKNGIPQETKLSQSVNETLTLANGGDIDTIQITRHTGFINNLAAIGLPETFYVASNNTDQMTDVRGINYGGGGNDHFIKGSNTVLQYNMGANSLAMGQIIYADFYLNNNLLGTLSAVFAADKQKHLANIPLALQDFDRIDFYINTGALGIPATAIAQSGSAVGICAASSGIFYTNDGTITTGKTVYTDISLSTPLAGADFIANSDGDIFAIDNVTGVVGAATGSTCDVPITGKNMFGLNVSGVSVDIDISGNATHFNIGENKNVVIKSDVTLTNNSGTTRTFSVYSAPPFIPANFVTSFTLVDTGTHLFPNDISLYNYMRIT